MQLYKNRATGSTVEISQMDDQNVSFYPQGGGFQRTMPKASFDEHFELVTAPEPFRKFLFSGDWMENNLVGYSDGRRWNGWAIPLVTKAVAVQIVGDLNAVSAGCPEDCFTARWEGETLMIFDPTEGEEFAVQPQAVQTDDGEVLLYDVSLGWCWDFVAWGDKEPV